MNEDLLKTPVVKSAVERYLTMKMNFEQIKAKLMDIHLIIVDDDALKEFIDTIKQGAKSK
jgi:hypothetical protein